MNKTRTPSYTAVLKQYNSMDKSYITPCDRDVLPTKILTWYHHCHHSLYLYSALFPIRISHIFVFYYQFNAKKLDFSFFLACKMKINEAMLMLSKGELWGIKTQRECPDQIIKRRKNNSLWIYQMRFESRSIGL